MIPIWQIFPYAVAVMELMAAIVHLAYGNYRVALIWAGVGIANLAFAPMTK